MKKANKILSLMLAGVMAASMTACSSAPAETTAAAAKAETTAASSAADTKATDAATTAAQADSSGKTYKIGVLQFVQHSALDATNKGFFAALDEAGIKYTVDQQNASGDQPTCQTIAQKLTNDKDDLILAIATPAAQAMAGADTTTPILLTAVTDPADAGLVADNKAPGGNVSGTSDLTPVKAQIELMQKLIPDAKTVGILYCSAEANSVLQASMAKEAIEAAGMTSIDYTVSNSNEIQTVVESMVGKVDVIYTPTDNMIAAGMPTVSMIANANMLPIICGEGGMVDAGGLATYGIDYYELGYMTGLQAIDILTKGADVATMPIGYLAEDKCQLSVNEETAKALGIDVLILK